MLTKRPITAILNTIEDTAVQLVVDGDAKQWSLVKTSAGNETLLGPFATGKIKSIEAVVPATEKTQLVIVDAATTGKETIVASRRYRIEIGNPEHSYETFRQIPAVHAVTAAATLSGTAATDRAVIYRALRDKINAYGGNNATAYTLTYAAFTLGGSVGNAATNFIVGETVTQETSGLTAKVAKCTITSGTFHGDDAAGNIWLYNLSTETGWLETLKTLTAAGTVAGVSTNCVVSVTDATTVHAVGLAVVDNVGYFTSHISRGGANYVGLTQGFSAVTPEVAIAAVYPVGIGSVMAALAPQYDHAKQNLLRGDLQFEFQDGDLANTAYNYNKYIITLEDGIETVGGIKEEGEKQVVIYAHSAAAHIGDIDTAIKALT